MHPVLPLDRGRGEALAAEHQEEVVAAAWTLPTASRTFAPPRAPPAASTSTSKEFVMNDKQTELEQQLVDLGDAKELTLGIPAPQFAEENPLVQGKRTGP
jgi:hypothetical protein